MSKGRASVALRLSDQGPCQNGIIRKSGKQNRGKKTIMEAMSRKKTWSDTSIDEGVWRVSMQLVRSSD